VIGFDRVGGVALAVVPGTRNQLLEDGWVDRRRVGDDLGRAGAVLEGAGDESAGGRQVPRRGHQHVDDLPELVDRPVQIDLPAGDLDVGFVNEPAISRDVSAWPGCVDEQGREPLHPPEHGHMIDLDTTLGQQFFDVTIGQAVLSATVGKDVGVALVADVRECRGPRPMCGAGSLWSGWRLVVQRVVVIVPGFIRR
jgi:hypothetical protein